MFIGIWVFIRINSVTIVKREPLVKLKQSCKFLRAITQHFTLANIGIAHSNERHC